MRADWFLSPRRRFAFGLAVGALTYGWLLALDAVAHPEVRTALGTPEGLGRTLVGAGALPLLVASVAGGVAWASRRLAARSDGAPLEARLRWEAGGAGLAAAAVVLLAAPGTPIPWEAPVCGLLVAAGSRPWQRWRAQIWFTWPPERRHPGPSAGWLAGLLLVTSAALLGGLSPASELERLRLGLGIPVALAACGAWPPPWRESWTRRFLAPATPLLFVLLSGVGATIRTLGGPPWPHPPGALARLLGL